MELTLEARYLSRLESSRQQLEEAGRSFRSYLIEKHSLPRSLTTGREILRQMEGKVDLGEWKTLKRIFDTLEEWHYGGIPGSKNESEGLYREMVRFVEGKKISQ